jgi:ATP citrate (pro-S)-lyase
MHESQDVQVFAGVGGGASVIYTDTVGDLGFAEELGNYAEYSGAPSTAETYGFALTLLQW